MSDSISQDLFDLLVSKDFEVKSFDSNCGDVINTNSVICAPTGGFANHIRWLMLIDKKYVFNYNEPKIWNKKIYNQLKDKSWPPYEEYKNLPHNIKTECGTLLKEEMLGTLLKEEMLTVEINNVLTTTKFIMKNVYPYSRTWYNWLYKEWEYRDILNNLIFLTHDIKQTISSKNKYIIGIIDPELAYKCYVKLNSNNNNQLKQELIDYINWHNSYALQHCDEKYGIVIDSGKLFTPTLSREIYHQCINFLHLDNNYDNANKIHQRWYTLHKNAEQKIISDLTQMYNIEF